MDYQASPMSFHEILLPIKNQSFLASACLAVAGLIALLYLLGRYLSPQHEHQEPLLIPQRIPYIGHVLGLARKGVTYYLDTSANTLLPIYTMHLLSSKVYVVNAPDLVSVVQRNSKTLSFYPFMISWLQPLLGLDASSMKIAEKDMLSKTESSWISENYEIHNQLLAPGNTVNQFENNAFMGFASFFNEGFNVDMETTVSSFVQRVFTLVNTEAMWGPKNPFTLHPELESPFWNVDEKFYLLLLNIVPKWTASGAAQDREKLTKSFCEYYNNGGLAGASSLVQERIKIGRKYGMSDDALARLDIGLAHALLGNSVPITTWMLLQIFSSPSLLAEIRTEVGGLLVRNGTDAMDQVGVLEFTRIQTECPLLVSVWQEVLRTTSHLPSGRTVLEDTMLHDKYLLKKGATVFIFSGVLHSDVQQWGPDFDQFNPRRFLPSNGQRKMHRPVAFRPFGGGHVLCPGRHLAFTEILTFVATVILGFDIKPENGVWPPLERAIYSPSLGVYKPTKASNVPVVISRRAEHKDKRWRYPTQTAT